VALLPLLRPLTYPPPGEKKKLKEQERDGVSAATRYALENGDVEIT
jgi:hypothetical protein